VAVAEGRAWNCRNPAKRNRKLEIHVDEYGVNPDLWSVSADLPRVIVQGSRKFRGELNLHTI